MFRRFFNFVFSMDGIKSAVSTLLSAIALLFSCRANKIAQDSLTFSKKQSCPIFVVESFLPEIEAGLDPYKPIDTIGVQIFNFGEAPQVIHSIEVSRIWLCEQEKKSGRSTVAFDILGFFAINKTIVVKNYLNEVASAFVLDNNAIEHNCYLEFMNDAPKEGLLNLQRITLVKIMYETKYGERCVDYFKEGKRIGEYEYIAITGNESIIITLNELTAGRLLNILEKR